MPEKNYNLGKEREKAGNTDNQATQYLNVNQNPLPEILPDNHNYINNNNNNNNIGNVGDTKVFKPLKKVDSGNNNQEYYQKKQESNYNNQDYYQRRNVNQYDNNNNYDNQKYQRRNINDYNNQDYQQRNANNYNNNNNYNNQDYQQRNVNNYNNNNYNNQNYQRRNVSDYNNNYNNQNYQQRPPQNPPRNPNPQNNKPSNPKPDKQKVKVVKKKKRSAGCLGRLIRSLIIIFIILFAIYSLISLFFIKKIEYIPSESRQHYSTSISNSSVKNILLIGTDTRDSSEERGRSDSMILLSLNSSTNKMYLTSIMRDSYVEINGHGWDKLTHAYSYGGPDLLMDTIEKNFSIKIDDYIAINFNAFSAIVDAVDGIEVEISDAEAEEINTILQAEVNELMGDVRDADLLEKGGKLILNGKQALSYSRIRYVGNSDFERTQRQRDVMTKIIEKVKSFNPSSISGIVKSALPQLSTNMSTGELYLLSLRLPFLVSYDLEQQRIPAEGTYYNTTTDDGGDALGIDFDANLETIMKTIFKNK